MKSDMFSVVDYIVLGVMVLISVAIGAFFAYRDKNNYSTRVYFLGSQKFKTLPVCLSYVATFQSSVLLIGGPAESYAYGMQIIIHFLGGAVALFLATVIVVPVFQPLKVTTLYEYYNHRFGNNYVRIMALIFGAINLTIYMSIVLYGAMLSLESAAGISGWVTVVCLSLAAIIYTSIGGFKSVIWTDVFQTVVMLAGILAVLIKTTIKAGGITKVMSISRSRLNFFDFNTDPTIRHTFWTLSMGGFMLFMFMSLEQASIQRMQSMASIVTAKRMFFFAGPFFVLVVFMVLLQGLTIYAYYYTQGCDPIASGQISNINQIGPFTIAKLFKDSPGLPGIYFAALAAASLSTISSGLTSLSSMLFFDCIKLSLKNMSEKKGMIIAKLMVVLFGLICIVSAFLMSKIHGPLGSLLIATLSAISGPEVGLYLVCVFFRKTTTKGAVVGFITGFLFVLWICIGQTILTSVSKSPYLPLGPTDTCDNISANLSDSMFAGNDTSDFKVSAKIYTLSNSFMHSPSNTSAFSLNDTYYTKENISKDTSKVTTMGLQKLYSISYMYFSTIGAITVILVSIPVSLVTQPQERVEVKETTMLPLTVLIPPCFQTVYKIVCLRGKDHQDVLQDAGLELIREL